MSMFDFISSKIQRSSDSLQADAIFPLSISVSQMFVLKQFWYAIVRSCLF